MYKQLQDVRIGGERETKFGQRPGVVCGHTSGHTGDTSGHTGNTGGHTGDTVVGIPCDTLQYYKEI